MSRLGRFAREAFIRQLSACAHFFFLAPLAILVPLTLVACGSVAASPSGPAGSSGAPGSSAAPGPSGTASSPGDGKGPAPQGPDLCAEQRAVTGLTIQRTGPVVRVPQEMFVLPPVTVDPAVARSLARALCALPQQRSGTAHCPADLGIAYKLRFTAGRQRFGAVTAEASGCRLVHGLGQVRTAAGATTFWAAIGRYYRLPGSGPVNRQA